MPEELRLSKVCWTGIDYPLGTGLPTVFTSNEGSNARHFVKCGNCWLDVQPAPEADGGQIRIISVSVAALCDQAALNALVNKAENSVHGR